MSIKLILWVVNEEKELKEEEEGFRKRKNQTGPKRNAEQREPLRGK